MSCSCPVLVLQSSLPGVLSVLPPLCKHVTLNYQVLDGVPFKGIVWNPKRKKSVFFVCGQRYFWTNVLRIALISRNQNPAYTIKKREGGTLIYWLHCACDVLLAIASGFGFDRGSMRTTVPSTRFSRAPVQSATLRLLTLWSTGSTPRPIVALPFARD